MRLAPRVCSLPQKYPVTVSANQYPSVAFESHSSQQMATHQFTLESDSLPRAML